MPYRPQRRPTQAHRALARPASVVRLRRADLSRDPRSLRGRTSTRKSRHAAHPCARCAPASREPPGSGPARRHIARGASTATPAGLTAAGRAPAAHQPGGQSKPLAHRPRSDPDDRSDQEQARTTARDAAQAAEAREVNLTAIHDQLAAAVEDLTAGESWAAMLTAASRFHRYSLGNVLLITAQRPDATRVAGFNTWKSLGRTVRKGEKGIGILVPCSYRPNSDSATDSDGAAGETPPSEQATGGRVLRGFRVAYVFDVSQTDGEPLADVRPELLPGRAPAGLWDALAAQVTANGYTLERGDCHGANGYSDPATRTVRVRADVDAAQAVKTLAHELAHVLLHSQDMTAYGQCRGAAEIEAESVAYVVTAAHGLDSAPYITAYVAGWANGDTSKVKATAQRGIATAAAILDAVTPIDALAEE